MRDSCLPTSRALMGVQEENMKITDVKLHVVQREVMHASTAKEFGSFGGATEIGVLRILTDEGIEGNVIVGNAARGGSHLFDPIVSVLKPVIVGRDASDREWLWSRFWTNHGQMAHRTKIPYTAWAHLDVALWDLAGKAANMPIYQMLGAQRHKIPVYTSSPYFPEIEKYEEEALQILEDGFHAYKLHPGAADVKRAQEICRRVRKTVGDRLPLMVDMGQLLSFREAITLGYTLDELDFYWYEDAIRWTDVDGLVELSRRLKTPMAVTDSYDFNFFQTAEYIKRGAARIMRNEVVRLGITGYKKVASLCEAYGLNCEVHFGMNSLMCAANLHVLLSIHNCDFYEILLPLEAYDFGTVQKLVVDKDGYVHAPTGPGLGLELDWDLINRLTVQVL